MAEMTIHLRCDPATGKKDIIVKLHPDADAMPHEHEQMHQQLLEKLIHGGLLKATEVGQVIVEREEPASAAPAGHDAPQQRPAQAQGN